MDLLCLGNTYVLARSKIFVILQFCVPGSASVIYNDIENKCILTVFANGSIAKMIKSQNNSALQYWLNAIQHHILRE